MMHASAKWKEGRPRTRGLPSRPCSSGRRRGELLPVELEVVGGLVLLPHAELVIREVLDLDGERVRSPRQAAERVKSPSDRHKVRGVGTPQEIERGPDH